MAKQLEELNSLRGLAALSVMATHYISSLHEGSFLLKPPFNIFLVGHEAVVFFFILSGFVLSLPYYKSENLSYAAFIIRRVCRIYFPYLVIITFYIIWKSSIGIYFYPDLSHYFNELFNSPFSWGYDSKLIINHLFFIGNYNCHTYNNVIWSLVDEMRISIIFPFIMLCILKFKKLNYTSLTFLLCLIGYIFDTKAKYYSNLAIDSGIIPTIGNLTGTFKWIILFILGALLAKNIELLKDKYASLNIGVKTFLFSLALILYFHPQPLFSFKPIYSYTSVLEVFSNDFIKDIITAIAAGFFIIASLSSVKASKILHNQVLLFFGKISYSLYLIHILPLLICVYFLHGKIQVGFLFLIATALTFLLSALSYKYLEKPFIKLGKYLTREKKVIN